MAENADAKRLTGLPEPYAGYDAGHRYIYSTEFGDSCSCGWRPAHFRTDPAEWAAHISAENADALPLWRRCWCYRYGRCLIDCPTADLPPPSPMTDDNWRRAYDAVVRSDG